MSAICPIGGDVERIFREHKFVWRGTPDSNKVDQPLGRFVKIIEVDSALINWAIIVYVGEDGRFYGKIWARAELGGSRPTVDMEITETVLKTSRFPLGVAALAEVLSPLEDLVTGVFILISQFMPLSRLGGSHAQ